MRVITAAVLGALVSACASGTSSSSGPTLVPATTSATQSIQGTGAVTGLTMTNEASSARLEVLQPLDVAWTRLQAAYATLGVKATTIDPTTHTIGNNSLRARRKIGDVPLITAMNCGMSGTGPNSESYELTLNFTSRVIAQGSGVIVETFINGTGQNPLTNSGNTVPCYSMGTLEKRIVALMTAK